jgi:hypothetical protein
MTDGEIATIFTKATGFMIDAEQPDLIGFARAIEKEYRRAALEEDALQWDGCFYEGVGERIDIGAAIRALSQKDPQ